jgi:hypothetical protein
VSIAPKLAYIADHLSTKTNRGLKRGNIPFCSSRFIALVCLAKVAARLAGRLRAGSSPARFVDRAEAVPASPAEPRGNDGEHDLDVRQVRDRLDMAAGAG